MTARDKVKICPRCENEYSEFPALSRRDNKTDICSDCGDEEALIDAWKMYPTLAKYISAEGFEREVKFIEKLGAK